jgi:hypothetical protein
MDASWARSVVPHMAGWRGNLGRPCIQEVRQYVPRHIVRLRHVYNNQLWIFCTGKGEGGEKSAGEAQATMCKHRKHQQKVPK